MFLSLALALGTLAFREFPRAPSDPARGENPGVRRALLVGVQEYPDTQGWPRLRGARADVEALRDVLIERAGFLPGNVRVLLDEQATHSAIDSNFRSLAAQCGAEDLLLFFFAGHGSQLPDQDGDEIDGMDETLIPFDSMTRKGEPNDIRDDVVHEWIAAANQFTPHVVMMFDCCSSGTNVRGDIEDIRRGVPSYQRGLAGVRPAGVPEEGARGARALEASAGWIDEPLSYVSLSACRAAESAYEVALSEEAEEHHGLFSLGLLQEFHADCSGLTYVDFLERVRQRVRAKRPNQTPVIEGPLRGNLLLQGRGVWRKPAFDLQVTSGDLLLRAGLVHGLSAGAVLAVHAGQPIEDRVSERLGRVRLDQVDGTMAQASWIEGPTRAVEAGHVARAFLLEAGDVRSRPGYAILVEEQEAEADYVKKMRASLDGTALLREVEPRDSVWWLGLEGAQDARHWVLHSRSDVRLPVTAAMDDAQELALLTSSMAHLARAHSLRYGLPGAGDGSLEVEVELIRLSESRRELGPVERDAGGVLQMAPGQFFLARLRNRSRVPIFASLTVISPDGSVFVLPLTPTPDDALPPGQSLASPALRAELSAGSEPFYRDGWDAYRWVVTTRYHDLGSLAQRSVSELGGTRGGRLAQPSLPDDAWLTHTMEVRLELPD